MVFENQKSRGHSKASRKIRTAAENGATTIGGDAVSDATMAGLEGLEPPTKGLGNLCSIHLSYSPGAAIVRPG